MRTQGSGGLDLDLDLVNSTSDRNTTSTSTSQSTTRSASGPPATKAVFAHYMEQAPTDIRYAIAAGVDGFALNTHTLKTTDIWNLNAMHWLFDAAAGTNFQLFISFDTSWGLDTKRLGFLLSWFSNHESYYKVDGRPFRQYLLGRQYPE
ncbi:glycosyl hydrolase family 71-domain-containing protein [Aspergillus crustosus]